VTATQLNSSRDVQALVCCNAEVTVSRIGHGSTNAKGTCTALRSDVRGTQRSSPALAVQNIGHSEQRRSQFSTPRCVAHASAAITVISARRTPNSEAERAAHHLDIDAPAGCNGAPSPSLACARRPGGTWTQYDGRPAVDATADPASAGRMGGFFQPIPITWVPRVDGGVTALATKRPTKPGEDFRVAGVAHERGRQLAVRLQPDRGGTDRSGPGTEG
jgi:hypothetical protein